MRRVVVLVLLALALPIAASANGFDFVNRNGVVFVSDAGIVSSNSHLVQFNSIVAPPGKALGVVSFATGALTSGSIFTGGTFSDVGSSFLVTGTGFLGVPKGPIFSGAFVGPILWNLLSESGNGCGPPPTGACLFQFQLVGKIRGQLFDGRMVTGTTTQNISIFHGQFLRDSQGDLHGGNTRLVPEPGTLALLGTGLVGVASLVRRKLAS
jgi:PEP-CTERM motif-containing protein